MIFYENNGNLATELIKGEAGKYHFCRLCQQYGACDYAGSKLTARVQYVLSYIYEFDAGVHLYPNPGSWEYQPHWFYSMFRAGMNQLNSTRNEIAERKLKAGKK